jgi:hypothetical protein
MASSQVAIDEISKACSAVFMIKVLKCFLCRQPRKDSGVEMQ